MSDFASKSRRVSMQWPDFGGTAVGDKQGRRRPLSRPEIDAMAEGVQALLADSDAGLSPDRRLRWEGALAALEAVLGQRSSLVDEGGSLSL